MSLSTMSLYQMALVLFLGALPPFGGQTSTGFNKAPEVRISGLPQAGSLLTIEVRGTPGEAGLLFLGPKLYDTPHGGLAIAPPRVALTLGTFPHSGRFRLPLRLIPDPALQGIRIQAQAWSTATGAVSGLFGPLTWKFASPLTLTAPELKPGARFGFSLAVGDVDSDGFDDLVIGAERSYAAGLFGRGEAFLFYGPEFAESKVLDPPDPTEPRRFGAAVAMGDVTNNGSDDIIIGANLTDDNGLSMAGKAWTYFAPQLTLTTEIRDPSPHQDGLFGAPLAIGDIDNDGYADVVIGAPHKEVSGLAMAGAATVVFGPSFARTIELSEPAPEAGAAFATSLAVGDIDLDGFDDVVVGVIEGTGGGQPDAGEAFVFFGPGLTTSINLTDPDPHPVDRFGRACAVGDFDGDGDGDVAISSYRADQPSFDEVGEVWVYLGPTLSDVVYISPPIPRQQVAQFGVSLAAGDIDGNGIDELAVGAEFADRLGGYSDAGGVYIYKNGPPFLSIQRIEEVVPQRGAVFGFAVVFGDFDANGLDGLAAGAITADVNGVIDAGRVTVFP